MAAKASVKSSDSRTVAPSGLEIQPVPDMRKRKNHVPQLLRQRWVVFGEFVVSFTFTHIRTF